MEQRRLEKLLSVHCDKATVGDVPASGIGAEDTAPALRAVGPLTRQTIHTGCDSDNSKR